MDVTDRFAELVRGPEEECRLDVGALLIAAHAHHGLDIDEELARLDKLAGGCPEPTLDGVTRHLFHDEGFQGDTDEYSHPRNSLLDDVLERRRGIPITLSVVVLEVARRLDVPLEGVGMPGHFLVRFRHPVAPVLFDPFAAGAIMSEADCTARLTHLYGPSARMTPSMLAPVSPRSILYRMLTNLKQIYVAREDWPRAVRTVDALLVVDPGATREYRDRGMLRFRSGDLRRARADFDHYLTMAAEVEDASAIRQQIGLIERLETMRN